jgi:hypothetical protein
MTNKFSEIIIELNVNTFVLTCPPPTHYGPVYFLGVRWVGILGTNETVVVVLRTCNNCLGKWVEVACGDTRRFLRAGGALRFLGNARCFSRCGRFASSLLVALRDFKLKFGKRSL